MEQTWEDKFADSGADPKYIAKATNILQALRANGVSQRRIDERGKGLLATLVQGKPPKASTTREERQRQASAEPVQQTMPDSVEVMKAEAAQLARELDGVEAKQARLSMLERMLKAGDES